MTDQRVYTQELYTYAVGWHGTIDTLIAFLTRRPQKLRLCKFTIVTNADGVFHSVSFEGGPPLPTQIERRLHTRRYCDRSLLIEFQTPKEKTK